MSVLVYAESLGGKCKKSAFEAVTYGVRLAQEWNTELHVLVIGEAENASELGLYGATSVRQIKPEFSHLDDKIYTQLICDQAGELNARAVILSSSSTGKTLAGKIAIKMDAALIASANSVLHDDSVTRMVFSGKAVATYKVNSDKMVISVMGNTIPPEVISEACPVEVLNVTVPASDIKVLSTDLQDGQVPLPEAELVVSGGRGFKGPENWGILLDLANALGAATACSRPVADNEWRPHHEHVGQTGVAISPNLYVAIGISGAIQHLGGVNNSKTIVVINKDPEAPFFKAADYGVVGDLFEVVPRLTEAVKQYKEQSS